MTSKNINDERFALVKINLMKKEVYDYFTNKIVMKNFEKSIFKSNWDNKMLVENNEVILIADNGTTINFHKKYGKKWEHFIGMNKYPMMMPSLDAYRWEECINNSNYVDINSRDRWGIGKNNKGKMWSDTKIVNMMLKDKRGGKR